MATDNISLLHCHIYNAANTNYVMDVSQGGLTDGTNVQLWSFIPGSDAQIYNVIGPHSSLPNTRIVSWISGKYLDVDNASTAVGTNVQTWTNVDPNWQGQRLTIVETGNSVTIKGESYSTYWISMSNSPDKVFAPTSLANGANIQLASKNTSVTKQEWAFVSVWHNYFEYNTIYEIRSLLDTRMALDVDGNGTVNGTNVQLFDANGTNAQRFYFQKAVDEYDNIRCLNSGKFLTVNVQPGLLSNGDNVTLWDDLSEEDSVQNWLIFQHGTVEFGGVICQIVSFKRDQGSHYFAMDVTAAQTSNHTNVQIWDYNGSLAQKFILYPTHQVSGPTGSTKSSSSATSSTALPAPSVSIPVPTDLMLQAEMEIGSNHYWNVGISGEYRYPCWKFTDGWVTSGPNHFLWRHRHRYLPSLSNTWEPWSSWTSWRKGGTIRGNQGWVNIPVKYEYDYDDYKNCEFEFQVRGATYLPLKGNTTEHGARVVLGEKADRSFYWIKNPTIAFQSAGWSPEGIRLAVSTDYAYGTTEFTVREINVGGKNILSKAQLFKIGSRDTSILIPASTLTAFPADGATITAVGVIGYDQWPVYGLELIDPTDPDYILSTTLTYDAGSTSVEPTFVRQGVRLYGIAPDLGTTRMWVGYDGELIECSQTTTYTPTSGHVAFEIQYPIGKAYEVFTSSTNSSGTQWGTDYTARPAESVLPFHGFDFNGGSAYLELFASSDGNYSESNERVYEADILDSRKYESVSYAPTTKSHLTVTGIISPASTSTVDDFDALLAAGHATYRGPDGQMFDVAVTNVAKTVRNGYTEISVNFVRETI